jgi:hypothetical protein
MKYRISTYSEIKRKEPKSRFTAPWKTGSRRLIPCLAAGIK